MNDAPRNLWQTKQFAQLAQVTVRTLHHYDRIGLLKPHHYDRHGFRLYGEREFARLQQIATLKFIGFSLNQIREILRDDEVDLAATLALQRRMLLAQRRRLNLALEAINRAERALNEDGATDWKPFQQITEVMN